MNKKFSRIFFGFALAFAMLIPMFATNASAQTTSTEITSVARVDSQFRLLRTVLVQTETLVGTPRVFILSGTMLGFTSTQLQLQASNFGVDLSTFVMASIISREINVPVTRIIQLNSSGRTFGQIVVGLGAPVSVTINSIRSFINVFTVEIGISNGTGTTTDEELVALLAQLIDLLNTRFTTLQVRLGNLSFEAILIARLSVETNTPIDVIQGLRSQFSSLTPNSFAIRMLLASSISATALQELQDLGFVFEDVNIVTPLGAARALGAFGIPMQVFVARVDVFQRLVKSDSSGTTDPGV